MDQKVNRQVAVSDKPGTSMRIINPNLEFYTTIDNATVEWLKNLNHIWSLWKKSKIVTSTLYDYFNTAPNPYLSTLRILFNAMCSYTTKPKDSMAITIIEDFQEWLINRKDEYKNCLIPDLKIAAFKLLNNQKNFQLMKLISNTYEFLSDKDIFLPILETMLREKKFKETAQYATMLQLQKYFGHPESILLPLILQTKYSVAEDFLNNCREIQLNLIIYLDNLLGLNESMHRKLIDYITSNKIPDVKMSTIHPRPMSKLVARLIKQYKLSEDICPNLTRKRSESGMQFLIYKRYVHGSLNKDCWREMVYEAVGEDINLQIDLITMIVNYDSDEALYWARTFEIPKNKWPYAITILDTQPQSTIDNTSDTPQNENDSIEQHYSYDTQQNDTTIYHTLNLSRNCIKIIDSPDLFQDFITDGLKSIKIVGIDAEWKPTFGIVRQNSLALIQVATESIIYILDVTSLGADNSEIWRQFGRVLFGDKNIIKLGFGLNHDMRMFQTCLPTLFDKGAHGFLDLHSLWCKLRECNFEFPYKGDEHFTGKSLSKMVELCVGRKLKKTDQFSNWEKRPLRERQIIYAALDAYCLLEIYNVISETCRCSNIPLLDICNELQYHSSTPGSFRKNSKRIAKSSKSIDKSPSMIAKNCQLTSNAPKFDTSQIKCLSMTAASQWRVLCDSNLYGLAEKLRMCGCNCKFVPYDCDGLISWQTAHIENRIFLTRDFNHEKAKLVGLSPNEYYIVLNEHCDAQLIEVLTHFNINVTENDIFSRCQLCNSNEFVQMSHDQIREFMRRYKNVKRPYPSYQSLNNHIQTRNKRSWILSTDTCDIDNGTTKYHAQIQADKIPFNVLKSIKQFYVCQLCGKVYWDGTELEQTLNGLLKNLITRI